MPQWSIFKYDTNSGVFYFMKISKGETITECDSYGDERYICKCGMIELKSGEYFTVKEDTTVYKVDAAINIFE